ncbi:hypothetical protein NW752_009300 [Fusarium irregulare]|uniref:F-box domain-containing protein n=1 Tax=Fusarium irregulare TaxID=2494466 RepID=A0A9W8PMA7_9HYPO|nr:hypothetical protein NW766_008834 [Fusarium irregulare]KAJ4010122.1 hypothetical protein NW752_009300 [Fusarium irregulare]
MAFAELPNEILFQIGEISDMGQLARLSQINRHFYELYNVRLYQRNALQGDPKSLVHWAARKGALTTIKLACRYGADLHSTGAPNEDLIWNHAKGEQWRYDERSKRTAQTYAAPLHLAVINRHEHIVKWLLENGARVDVPSVRLCGCSLPNRAPQYSTVPPYLDYTRRYHIPPWYPLHYAISHGANESIVSLLVKHGARYAMKGFHGIIPAVLELAKPAIDTLLIQGDFDPSWEGDDGATAFHLLDEGEAFHHHLQLEQRCDKVLVTIKGLAAQGVPINAQAKGQTILNIMLSKGNLLCAIELLKAGADASDKLHARRNAPGVIDRIFENMYRCRIDDKKWVSNVQLAKVLMDDQRKALKLAIERGADVNRMARVEGQLPTRPLYRVLLFSRDVKCVEMMLDAGAMVDDSGELLRTFFDSQKGYLCYRYNDDRPMDETDLEPFKRALKLLLKRGARIDAPSQLQNSALIEVCDRATNVVYDSQYRLVNREAYRYQLQRLEGYYDRATYVKRDLFFELEFLVKYATIQNVSAEYVKVLMRRNQDEGKVQDLLKQLHAKLLSGIGQDDYDDDDEFDDIDEEENEPDPRSCSVCNPVRPS